MFLDGVNLTKGHVLVITKEHVEWIWDYENFSDYLLLTQKTAKHLREHLKVPKVDMLVSGGSVPHVHIHLLPNTFGVWLQVLTYIRELRKTLVPEATTIDPAFVEKLKFS